MECFGSDNRPGDEAGVKEESIREMAFVARAGR